MAESKGGASNIAKLVTKQAGRAKEKVKMKCAKIYPMASSKPNCQPKKVIVNYI